MSLRLLTIRFPPLRGLRTECSPKEWLLHTDRRFAHSGTTSLTTRSKAHRTRLQWATATGAAGLAMLSLWQRDDDPILNRVNPADRAALAREPLERLVGGWLVYAFCSSTTLIEASESIFNVLHNVPVLSSCVDLFARKTFFAQFFAGQNALESEINVWGPLREHGVGVLCGYNVEAGYGLVPQTSVNDAIKETIASIKAVGLFGVKNSTSVDVANGDTRCWVRTKLTGLTTDPEVFARASEVISARRSGTVHFPGVPEDGDWQAMNAGTTEHDQDLLRGIYTALRSIMNEGQQYGVRVIIDAEQTWFQPAIDVFTEELMREFNGNSGPPIVCATFQAYLRRNTDLIHSQIERARQGDYKLIFKQVRGAYIPYEIKRWTNLHKSGPPPVWDTKAETDASYNEGIRLGLSAIKTKMNDPEAADVAAIYATHNEISCDEAVKLVGELGLGQRQPDGSFLLSDFVSNRLAFAQIYGMKDSLTNRLAAELKSYSGLPVVCKSAAYGSLDNALPNLSRRAVENKTVMEGRGGAKTERKRLAREICRRMIPFYSQ